MRAVYITRVNVVLLNHPPSSGGQQGDGISELTLIPTTKIINRKLLTANRLCVSVVKVSF